jgi:hypothetical protein
LAVSGRAELDSSGCSPPRAFRWVGPRGPCQIVAAAAPLARLGGVGSALLTASSARRNASGEVEQSHVGLSRQRNFRHTSVVARSVVQLKTGRRHTLSNKGMKLTKPGELRSFAAYPRCSTDSSRASTTSRLRSPGSRVSGLAELASSGRSRLHDVGGAARCRKGRCQRLARRRLRGVGRLGSALLTASSARPDANSEAKQTHVGLSPQRNFGQTSVVARSVVQLKTGRRHTLSNKGMKLTKPEHIGASQLIPGVRQTRAGRDARMRQAA